MKIKKLIRLLGCYTLICTFLIPIQVIAQQVNDRKTPCENEPQQKSSIILIIKNVTPIDGTGAAPKSNITIVIEGNRIKEVLTARSIKIPRGVKVIDGKGKFVIPGLWDMHIHLSKAKASALPLFIVNGITSARDMGGDLDELKAMRRKIESGETIGPRMKLAGPMLESPQTIVRGKASVKAKIEDYDKTRIGVDKPEDAEGVIKRLKDAGVDFVKIRTYSSPETYFAIAKAAKEAGLKLVGHAPEALDPIKVADAGQASIEHGFYPFPNDKFSPSINWEDIVDAFVKNKTAFVPTIVTWQAGRTVPYETLKAITEDASNKLDSRRKYLSPFLVDYWRIQLQTDQKPKSQENMEAWKKSIDSMAQDLAYMYKKGVPIMPGTDLAVIGVYPGFSLHDELELFVTKIGMTPMQTIESATRVPAEFFGMQDCLGTVERNKIADIVLLDANPLENVGNTRRIDAVVANGRYFSRSNLQKLLKK